MHQHEMQLAAAGGKLHLDWQMKTLIATAGGNSFTMPTYRHRNEALSE